MHSNFATLNSRTRTGVSVLLISALPLAACSREPETLEAAVKVANCQVVELSDDVNIFNGRSAKCDDDSRVYWFPTSEANSTHAKLCANFGGKKIAGGATWTRYKPSC